MDDWTFKCPKCGSGYFGTNNPGADHKDWIRYCKGYWIPEIRDYTRCDWQGTDDQCNGTTETTKEKVFPYTIEKGTIFVANPVNGETING